ncbi:ADP-ribosylglycohydrolase [Saccharothrix carnea]|uniref:ADP-ribosylglycohydrolase n=1 Tax=Saccharothrix carnea TaxID=1280637 RepID=A0A2P8IEX8_SACCR|nr:ADP-ribosylglycohydrolase family protein [Saccharothrix carnea]PSL57003.1 ADP-ribosylglycohydrolase [Saccharothrix carnea]
MTPTAETLTRTARGIFLGAAVGDALGWPQEFRGGLVGGQKERDRATPRSEFRGWVRNAGHYSRRYRDPVRAGEYSDDTQLLLATARCCLAGDRWWERLTEVELPSWPLYQRGGGGAVLRAAASWSEDRPPWHSDSARTRSAEERYRNAGANGVAMRIAPHVLWADGPEDLVRRVVRDGITTHGHPRALVGALVYAFVLRHAASSVELHGFGDSVGAATAGLIDVEQVLPMLPSGWGTAQQLDRFASTWMDTNNEAEQLLDNIAHSLSRGAMSNPNSTLEQLGCTDPKVNGSGTISAVAAVYLASRFAARPQGGLVSAAFLRKGDTDTLASLTAAILGALHGEQWLGDLRHAVQDAHYVGGLAESVAARTDLPLKWPTRPPRVLRYSLLKSLLDPHAPGGEFPDGRQFIVRDVEELSGSGIRRAQLTLDDGQTVFVDVRVDPNESSHRRAGTDTDHRGAEPSSNRERKQARQGSRGSENSATSESLDEIAPIRVGTGVVLATGQLARTAGFYARLIGCDIRARGRFAEVSSGLLLHQVESNELIETSGVTVRVAVDNLKESLRRMGLEVPHNRRDEIIELTDPDGRRVLVNQMIVTVTRSQEVHWDRIDANDFERLLVRLLEQSEAYERAGDTTSGDEFDTGIDGLAYVRTNENPADSGQLVIFQAKHSPNQMVSLAEIEDLVNVKLHHFDRGSIGRLVIATTGSLSRTAVRWVEKYNQDKHPMSIGVWSSNDLEMILRRKPEILAEFGLLG